MEEDSIGVFLNCTVEFVERFRKLREKYAFYNNAVQELDKATQDILHKLELDRLSSGEKCKWATQLANIRKDRRYYKDKAECLKTLIDCIDESKSFANEMNRFGNVAGNVRKNYMNRQYRKYAPRFINEMKINSQKKRVKGE